MGEVSLTPPHLPLGGAGWGDTPPGSGESRKLSSLRPWALGKMQECSPSPQTKSLTSKPQNIMALSAVRANNSANRPNTTDFSAALTPLEFVAKFGSEQYAIGETDKKHTLALSCKDSRGVVTSAYAAGKLQEQFAATPEGQVFTLPENVMVAPWIGNNGKKNWMLYLQGDIDLSAHASSRIAQTLSR